MKKILLLNFLLLTLLSCMKQNSASIVKSSETATSAIGCKQLKSKVFDSMYSYLDQEKSTPDLKQLKSLLSKKIDQLAKDQKISDLKNLENFKTEYSKIFDILISESKNTKNITNIKSHIQLLIELEMEDQSSKENIQLNHKLSTQFTKVSELSNSLNLSCNDNSSTNTSSSSDSGSTGVNQKRMVAGMNNVFSTAYQSCEAPHLAPMTSATPDVIGITRLAQNHPDGVGGRRIVSDLSAVQQTHPYVKVAGQMNTNSCFNVYDHPLIYDYGGEPSVANNKLSFFSDAGTGTSVLGVDCSSLVSSAAAAGGLRYKPGLDNKAIFIRQTSDKFIDANSSGFSCFQNISVTPTQSIKPGDIAAVHGHVVMVDSIGADPFGLKRLSGLSDCANLNSNNFDFVIAQSSPSKNGVGINKYVARDYLNESPKMKTLFTGIGIAACKAYFQNSSSVPHSSEWGVIRHKGTAECLAPKIQITGQSCVSQCQM